MSRAFVREQDQDGVPELPELLISPHPNWVTASGLQQIEAKLEALEAERHQARQAQDKATLARVARDLRYWNQRRGSARLVPPPPDTEQVRFGLCVALRFDDGAEQRFRLVGEDEADPANALLSWVAPLARALAGRRCGDTVTLGERCAEIVAIEA